MRGRRERAQARASRSRTAGALWMIVTVASCSSTTGCVMWHYRNPLRQKVEYNRTTRRLGEDRLARVRELDAKPLRDAELNTAAATLEGVFIGRSDGAAGAWQLATAIQNFDVIEFDEREQVPYEIETENIIDEATLVSREPQTCIEVTLRGDALYDQSFEDLAVSLTVDSEEIEALEVSQESSHQASLWYEQRYRVIFIHEAVFDTTVRHATICAPVVARSVVTLALGNALYSAREGELWQLIFRWQLEGQ